MLARYIAGSLIAAVAIYLIVTRVDIGGTLALLITVRPDTLAACAAIYLAAHSFRALRFGALLRTASPGFPALLSVVSVHNLLNQVMPVRTGESAYPVLVRKYADVGYSRGITTLLLVRVYDLAAFAGIFCVFMLDAFVAKLYGWPLRAVAVSASVAGLAFMFRHIDALAAAIAGWVSGMSGHPGLRSMLGEKSMERAGLLADGMKQAVSGGGYLKLGAYTVCVWLLTFAMFHVFVTGIRPDTTFSATVIGSSGAVLTGLLPVNAIGSVGTLEGGWTLGMVAVGLDREAALASGVMMHAFVIVYGLLLSLVGGLYLRMRHG